LSDIFCVVVVDVENDIGLFVVEGVIFLVCVLFVLFSLAAIFEESSAN
jgi:hypothetical protein